MKNFLKFFRIIAEDSTLDISILTIANGNGKFVIVSGNKMAYSSGN